MSGSNDLASRSATVWVRLPAAIRDEIAAAAEAAGISIGGFVVEAARMRASDVLMDQREFRLAPEAAAMVADVLAEPPRANAALRRLMRSASPWS